MGRNHQAVRAPAKVNLSLGVVGRRADGYHDIKSVAAKVTLYDGIDVATGTGSPIKIECTHSAVPTDSQNLIWLAVQTLAAQVDRPESLLIRLHKKIPMGAGLGGGSSDAAAILKLLNCRWQLDFSLSELTRLAARIGSDVPLFLQAPTVYISGRGEIVESVKLRWTGWLVLLLPPFGVSTAAVYSHWQEHMRHVDVDARACLGKSINTAKKLGDVLFNDLQESIYVVEPRIKTIKEAAERRTSHRFHISGSGSAMFACVDAHDDALQLKQLLDQTADISTQIIEILTLNDNE